MPFLEARTLSKTYRNAEVPVPVFENLNLEVEQGEMLAVVGPSGIGKFGSRVAPISSAPRSTAWVASLSSSKESSSWLPT